MKQIFLIILIVWTIHTPAQNQIKLIPLPVEVKPANGSFKITRQTSIVFNKPDGEFAAKNLAERINQSSGFILRAQQGNSGSIFLKINETVNSELGKEGYTLDVTSKGIVITANYFPGLFYGVQTLVQLFPKEIENSSPVKANWIVPAVNIKDYPRFEWRGIMFDVSRHFFTKEEVKRYIDQMARFKYNIFHWHLTDDNGWRIEIKSLPKLTEIGAWRVQRYGHFGEREEPRSGEPASYGGFYTQDDIREIVKYARDRNVTIIPEIDVPGHCMAVLAAYPELSCTQNPNIKVNPGTNFAEWFGDGSFKMLIDNTLNPSDEKVYDFLDKVFTEVTTLFPAPYIHVGGDECYKGFWQQDEDCIALMKKMNLRHVEELQGYFMSRVETILKNKGKKLLGWDEILEGGISTDATVMCWREIEHGIKAARLGHEVVMTPAPFTYIDYSQGDHTIEPPYKYLRVKKCYSFEPVPDEVDPKYILGGEGALWTERIETIRHAEYMTYPRAWALSEVFWSPAASKSWDNFIPRMEHFFERAQTANINYSAAVYDAIIRTEKKDNKLMLIMETEIPGLDIYYSLNNAMPDNHTEKYTGGFELPDGPVTLKAITYRNNKPVGHLITLSRKQLESRVGMFK